jgi:hypothetical protein
MTLTIKEVANSKDLKEFIYLPEKIHKGHENWLPPIYMDEKKYFDSSKNLSFRGCDTRMLLAYKDGKPVGRIMGIIHHAHNELFKIKNVRFSFIECYNDPEVSHALISDIENWGKQHGMTKIIGPFGFSDRDIQGLLIEGFEYEPVIDSASNFEYLPELVIKEGYTKELDLVIYRFLLSTQLPEVYDKIYQRITSRQDLVFHEFTTRKELKKFILPALHLMNISFSDIYGFVPIDDKEMFELAERYLPVLDPKFVKMVTKGDEVVAFLVNMPNIYKGIQKSKGRLLPFGIFHILHAMKHAKSANTMLGAVKPSFQKFGLDAYLTLSSMYTARKAGMTSLDTHVVMEDNGDMMNEFKRYGASLLKKFRVFQKDLS